MIVVFYDDFLSSLTKNGAVDPTLSQRETMQFPRLSVFHVVHKRSSVEMDKVNYRMVFFAQFLADTFATKNRQLAQIIAK